MDLGRVWAQAGCFGVIVGTDGVISDVTDSAAALFGVPVASILGTRWDDWIVYDTWPALVSKTGRTTRIRVSWVENQDKSRSGWVTNADSDYAVMQQSERYADDLKQLEFAVSHDLMEPIRMISGYLSLYMEEDYDKRNTEYIQKAQHAVTITRGFLTDFVRYLRLDSDRRNSAMLRIINLNEIVSDVLQSLHLLVREADADIQISELPTGFPGDGRMFYQVFSNLIANSLKYRDVNRPCKIRIHATETATEYVITVEDNGRGIHPSKIGRVFAPFVRGYKEIPGSGIGLAIVKRCLEYHDGSIRVSSVLGEGTVFTIKLPKVRGTPETSLSPR